jgi:putative acetyltransferase
MEIRKMRKDDNQAVGELVQAVLKAHGLNLPGTAYFDPHLFELYDYYQQKDAAYWVIEAEGKVVGGVGIGPFDRGEKIGELQKLYILEEAQGKGFGRQLISLALNFAKEYYTSCYIETFASLDAANHLYSSYGFEQLEQPLEGTEHSACDTWLLKKW